MNSRTLKVLFGGIGDYLNDTFSISTVDSRERVGSMLEKRGFSLENSCADHEHCHRALYRKGGEAFVVDDLMAMYNGPKDLGTGKSAYDRCRRADARDCEIPDIAGDVEYVPNIDMPRKLREQF